MQVTHCECCRGVFYTKVEVLAIVRLSGYFCVFILLVSRIMDINMNLNEQLNTLPDTFYCCRVGLLLGDFLQHLLRSCDNFTSMLSDDVI